MADSRSQMGFGQIGPQGQGQPGGFTQGQFSMMQQQQFAMMQQQHQQQQQQQMAQQQGNAMMMGQQPNAMMQQVGPGMQPGMMPQQQFPQQQMFPGQMQQQMPMGMYMIHGGQYVQAGFPQGVVQGQNFTPPPYTPKMAQEFKHKSEKLAARQARQLEEQRRRVEAEHKARKFLDQQKRLKELSAIGGRKMDADSLIKHIIGPDMKGKTGPGGTAPQQPAVPAAAMPADDDDGFGDFIQGPTVQDFTQPAVSMPSNPALNNATLTAKQSPSPPMSGPALTQTPPPSHTPPISQATPPPQGSPTPPATPMTQAQTKEEKKDLEKMMFASCDLTAPQKARTFHKRTLVKDAPKQVRAVTYQPSQKARAWSGESEKLSDLFTLPAPEPPLVPPSQALDPQGQPVQGQAVQGQGQAAAGSQGQPPQGQAQPGVVPQGLPAWCMGEVPLPDLYTMVLHASIREGKIQTDLVYPILVRSGLPREVLGAIWAMANKTVPGQLLPQELCAALALIAVAQNNMAVPSIEILHRLPGPPIPNLGQAAPAGADPNTQAPQPQQPTPTPGGATVPPGSSPGVGAPAAPGKGSEEDDFADFQEAPVGVQPSDSFGDFTAASPVNATTMLPGGTLGPGAVNKTTPDVLIGDEDKYNAFRQLNEEPAAPAATDLFPSSDSKDPPVGLQPVGLQPAGLQPTGIQPAGLLPNKPPTTSGPTQPEVAAFMGQPLQDKNSSSDFADFTSATTTSDGFADFQTAAKPPSTTGAVSGGGDKFAALKALVSDNKLYQPDENQKGEGEGEEDWAEFSSSRDTSKEAGTGKVGGDNDKYSALSSGLGVGGGMADNSVFPAPPQENVFASKKPKQKELFPADDDEDTEEWGGFTDNTNPASTNWADFSAAPAVPAKDPTLTIKGITDEDWSQPSGMPTKPTAADWALNSSKNESDLTNFGTLTAPKASESKPKESGNKAYSTTNKKFNLFARNLEATTSGVMAGTGMSPLDFQPPELPDCKDDEDLDDFDKFGTFRGVDADVITTSSTTGISSLGAPFGGMDDVNDVTSSVDMFGYSSRPRTHAQPQKDTADSVSISSNEFTGWKVPSSKAAKESDTQSVSSLDFATKAAKSSKDGSPVGGDSQSVSSLEFGAIDRKSATPADERSIASLELKVVSTPEDAPVDAPGPPPPPSGLSTTTTAPTQEEDGFGEFSSATDGPKNGFKTNNMSNMDYVQRPRAASDLLRRGDLPSIVDRYSSLAVKQEDEDRHVSEWERCLDKCRVMLEQAANSFTSITDSALCDEVLHSRQGTQYIQGVVEIYRVVCRITEAMRAVSITNPKLVQLLKSIDTAWLDLVTLLSDTQLKPSPGRLDFSGAVLKAEEDKAQERACGVCLLNVDARSKRSLTAASDEDHKLTYGGRQYHASCANFWVNCVDSMLPALKIPELL